MNIAIYQNLCKDENIAITQHARQRFIERSIFLDDIENAILHGTIIEEYPNDSPFPSCLILGPDGEQHPLHIVASTNENTIYIITAYRPDPRKWNENFSTRKE